jgi:HK97 family phage prohead protease
MKREMSAIHVKRLGGTKETIDVAARTATFVFSSSSADRMGDIIDQASWQLDRYKQNPVFLWAHNSRQLPVGKTVDLYIKGNKLYGTVQFATEDENPLADQCWRLVVGGYLSAVSVGFMPHRWESYDNGDGESGYKLFDCELLECSLVPIPCNQDALLGKAVAGMDKLRAAYVSAVEDYSEDLGGVFGKAELEGCLVKMFGAATGGEINPAEAHASVIVGEQPGESIVPKVDGRGTKVVPGSDTDGQDVYDKSGELMGIMVGGSLKVTRAYQDKIRARNLESIEKQAAPTSAATTEKETGKVVGNFFLRRAKARALARRTLFDA